MNTSVMQGTREAKRGAGVASRRRLGLALALLALCGTGPRTVRGDRVELADGRVLDAGCGGGRDLALLLDLGFDGFGTDPSAGMREAAARAYPQLAGRIHDFGLPLPEPAALGGLFDGIVCSAVLMHVPAEELSAALASLRRALRPIAGQVRFWEGSFAGFASIISKATVYVGYDSAGQHAAAAAGVPVVTVFAGATSGRFMERWAAKGAGRCVLVDVNTRSSAECLAEIAGKL